MPSGKGLARTLLFRPCGILCEECQGNVWCSPFQGGTGGWRGGGGGGGGGEVVSVDLLF